MLPLTAYIHLPWCVRKCPYCDFNSHAGMPDELAYVEALIRDIDFEVLRRARWPALQAIFIGGGTPSLFSAQAIGRVLEHLEKRFAFRPNIEITIEANPGTVDAAHFRGYRAAGVNRISIGVQSFSDVMLKSLGRIHDGAGAVDAFRTARTAGFENINIDLMHGLPGQDQAGALADLQQGLVLQPEHLSWYQLTIEANTAFGQKPPVLPDDDLCADIEDAGFALLRQAGLRRYEVSAFARPGRRSRHNLNYWRFGDYLGLGAGAHGKITEPERIVRTARLRSPQRYMATAGSAEALARQHSPSPTEIISEFALNTLRIDDAFTRRRFEATTQLPFTALTTAIDEAQALELVRFDGNTMKPTALGRRHLNRLLECFAEISDFH